MVAITEQQVRQAEAKAEQAEQERVQAARRLESNPYSDLAAAEHSDAARLAAQLGQNVRELREAYAKQVEQERARLSRPALEKAAAGEIKAAGVELAERERGVVEALEQAQEALSGLLAAGAAYNSAVESHAGVLAGAGLDVNGGESGGVRTILDRYLVQVRGRRYEQVNVGALGGWLLHRVVEARLSRGNEMVSLLQWVARVAEQDAPRVVAGVSAPERVVSPRRPRVVNAYQAAQASK
ncbi:hypothetical protein ACFZCL_10310 [Streptomyces sp. NPDC008159]|uniref:hypothetical protein n=1 Tax=Streptomyces sp. NPDC008159 TaxID=3364817 RepID=UPI0036E34C53